jgi:hypothetical protein
LEIRSGTHFLIFSKFLGQTERNFERNDGSCWLGCTTYITNYLEMQPNY